MNVLTESNVIGNYNISDIVYLKFLQPDIHKDKNNYILYSYLQHTKMNTNELLSLYIFLSYKHSDNEIHRKHFYKLFDQCSTISVIPITYFNQFLDVYCKYTSFLNRISQFVSRVKYRYTKKYDIDCDLCLNKFEMMSADQKIILVENDTLFTFSTYDLVKIFRMNLLNCGHLLFLPQMPKNPYTNLEFSYTNLVKISKMLKRYYHTPAFIHSFIELDFDLERFSYYNQQILIDNCVNRYIDELDTLSLFSTLIVLFRTYTCYILVTSFSNSIIQQNMKSLRLYYKMEYNELNNISSDYTNLYKKLIYTKLIHYVLQNKDNFILQRVVRKRYARENEATYETDDYEYIDENTDEDATIEDDV